ncbi:hypothetical protein [Legionella micdadei]|uniref:Uncharacterized protein n=1 Tax=Legionella micdadei TaxID=451 RepID=A0A098GG54_LEGMI|nr:hypothetical protein [Legionella micdadei]KTD27544.1 hypothetical protein Lmic_1864 [Legionella micdadei]CEG60967.1 protein of unknown function [phage DNA injection protein motif] [Legionella micdadei]SCY69693.1 hypothetical protein SAMN02982997_02538 [Legionella micdadei]
MAYTNPATNAMPYLTQIPSATVPFMAPYYSEGINAIPTLRGEYGALLQNPGGKVNEIGASFHESPGFKFALQQALQGAGHKAAAEGMYGSPEHEQRAMELAINLANQDYYNWIDRALPLYNQGLGGEQGFYTGGLQSGTNIADMIAQTLAQQGQLSYAGQQNLNQLNAARQNAKWNAIGQGLGTLSAFIPFKTISDKIGGLLGGE